MRTPITLQEFLFTLNQDEDMQVHIIDYMNDERLYSGWKSDFNYRNTDNHNKYKVYKNWFVQDFVCTTNGLEITIVELEKELD